MTPTRISKLRIPGQPEVGRTLDVIGRSLEPVARALQATPIMGAPPPPWIRPDLATGWANIGTPYAVAAYHKDALGYVHGKGVLKNVTAGVLVAGTTVWTLPQGYRSFEQLRFSVPGAGVTAQELSITPGGVISNNANVAAGAALDIFFYFLAEQ